MVMPLPIHTFEFTAARIHADTIAPFKTVKTATYATGLQSGKRENSAKEKVIDNFELFSNTLNST